MLAKTRAMGVTMTSYLAAAQMLAAYQEMPALERGKVISVSLPVNLRSYYGTETARNFFQLHPHQLGIPGGRNAGKPWPKALTPNCGKP